MNFSHSKIEPQYLDLRALAAYTSVSVRTWRDLLRRPDAPPIFRLPGKILVAKADVDAWLRRFREQLGQDVGAIVDEVMKKVVGEKK
jgi:hypothetical protein